MPVCLLATAIASMTFAMPGRDGIRDRFLRGLVLFGAAVAISTEAASAFRLIRRAPLIVFWAVVIVAALLSMIKWRPMQLPRLRVSIDPVVAISSIGILAILALTAVTAAFSPPNSSDAMAYHMPRVVYWAQQSSVR